MARQTHTPKAIHNTLIDLAANAADLSFVAANTTDKEQVAHTGKEVILAWNTGATDHTATVTSVEDPYGRTEDMGPYTISAGEIARLGPFSNVGWRQADGKLYFEADHAEVKFAVLLVP